MGARTLGAPRDYNENLLGLQRNGIFAVCGGLVSPSPNLYDFSIVHHISTGQILNLSTKSNGYIQSAEKIDTPSTILLDAEPDWENDFTSVLIAVRRNGQQTYSLIPCYVESSLNLRSMRDVFCTCNKITRAAPVSVSETWVQC